jgi:hypothetical protein
MHAVGFLHEQNREDRDGFVTIQKQNIKSGFESNFEKAPKGTTVNYAEYDYGSVMHYSPLSFSKNNKATIVARQSNSGKMGQREGLSEKDIRKINSMYKCSTAGNNRPMAVHSAENETSTSSEGLGGLFNMFFQRNDEE